MDRGRTRLALALAAVVGMAEGAVRLLRPRGGVIEPVPVSARSYFSAQELARARAFRRPQLALYAAQSAVELAVLGGLVRRPPRWLRGPFRRPLLSGAAVGSGLSVLLALAPLPLAAIARRRAIAVGLITQPWRGWAVDLAKSTAIGAGFAGAGASSLLALARRFPRAWWLPASGAVVAVSTGLLYVGPALLDPIFNRFEALPAGRTRSDVLELARRAGVSVGEVYEVDASRRTTAANAYVTGLGPTKRVVLFDTLLERFSAAETSLVIAHELAHVRHRDVVRYLAYLALVAPAGLFAASELIVRLSPDDARPGTPAVLPAAALALGLVAALGSTVGNRLSRRVEQRADAFSLRLTGEAEAFIGSERRLAVQNVADPDPPRWLTALLASHPPTIERIGMGVAFAQAARSRD